MGMKKIPIEDESHLPNTSVQHTLYLLMQFFLRMLPSNRQGILHEVGFGQLLKEASWPILDRCHDYLFAFQANSIEGSTSTFSVGHLVKRATASFLLP